MRQTRVVKQGRAPRPARKDRPADRPELNPRTRRVLARLEGTDHE